jgi:hypothetical protein
LESAQPLSEPPGDCPKVPALNPHRPRCEPGHNSDAYHTAMMLEKSQHRDCRTPILSSGPSAPTLEQPGAKPILPFSPTGRPSPAGVVFLRKEDQAICRPSRCCKEPVRNFSFPNRATPGIRPGNSPLLESEPEKPGWNRLLRLAAGHWRERGVRGERLRW